MRAFKVVKVMAPVSPVCFDGVSHPWWNVNGSPFVALAKCFERPNALARNRLEVRSCRETSLFPAKSRVPHQQNCSAGQACLNSGHPWVFGTNEFSTDGERE